MAEEGSTAILSWTDDEFEQAQAAYQDIGARRDFGPTYLEKYVGISWDEYFLFLLFWPQHFFYLLYLTVFLRGAHYRAFRNKQSTGGWGGWSAYNRKQDFVQWYNMSRMMAGARSPLASNDVVLFDPLWGSYRTKNVYSFLFWLHMKVEQDGMRAWIMPGCLYEPDGGSLFGSAMLHAHDQIIEGLARKFTAYQSTESPFNAMAKGIRNVRKYKFLNRWPWRDSRYYLHVPLRRRPFENYYAEAVMPVYYGGGCTAVDECSGFGRPRDPFIWGVIEAHSVFRRTWALLGYRLDYTDWTSDGLLRRCLLDKNSWVYYSTGNLGSSRVARTLYAPEGDPFLLSWMCAPSRTLHPLYGMTRPWFGKTARRRSRGSYSDLAYLDSPAYAVHDSYMDACALAGFPSVGL